jgi:voltage-gated potassium channel
MRRGVNGPKNPARGGETMNASPPNNRPLYATYHTPTSNRPTRRCDAALFEVIFEAETPAGKAFDVALLIAIVLSVVAVMLDSVGEIRAAYGPALQVVEWLFTILFSLEYVLRLISVRRPRSYVLSFFGLVDLLAVLPTYASLLTPGAQTLLVIRVLRLLRVFRVFKLTRYLGEARLLSRALAQSRRKIVVFIVAVLTLVVIMGSLMYLIEGPANGFTSIPRAVYWAIVTMRRSVMATSCRTRCGDRRSPRW